MMGIDGAVLLVASAQGLVEAVVRQHEDSELESSVIRAEVG